jgi:undecaprenyl diphosphate synthase
MKPNHVAIIMDGNGRWAQMRRLARGEGHIEGAAAVRRVVRHARKLGVHSLTLFAFSSLNWGRPTDEVSALMDLLMEFLESEQVEMLKNDIKLTAIGEREFLPTRVRNQLESVEASTINCKGMSLVLAVSYDGRRDIVRAVQKLTLEASKGEILPADIDEVQVMRALSTRHLPDVDLLIRTSGEFRLSGFLPLEACYAELYFVDKLWPDFQEKDLEEAIADFERRQRRFGLLSDQTTAAPA